MGNQSRIFKFKVTRMFSGKLHHHYVESESFNGARDIVEAKYKQKGCVICVNISE